MEYMANSVIISRKRDKKNQCFSVLFALFDITDPHLSTKVPLNVLEFEKITQVVIKDITVNYMTEGSDIVINGLSKIKLTELNGEIVFEAA